ncbi:MAG: BatA and WFA domain-containing protein [Bryobacteraceae bacterium]
MGFLSPLFLGGLLAAAVPLYVHLLRQHKTVPQQFSSLMFFEKRTQSSIKHRRLKYIALLLLRLAMILLLALMFANPFITRSGAAAAEGKKLLIVAVDNSFSMRAEGRLERAKQEAGNALAGFRAGDTGQVLTFASSVQLLTQPVENLQELQAAVTAIQPGDGRSAYGEIARLLRSLGTPSALPVEAHIISDMQRSSLPSPFSELALNPNTRLVLHPVSEARLANFYVESVNAPRSVFQARKVRIQATIAGAGTPAAEVIASLILGGKSLESRKVSLPPNGRVSVEFFLPDAAYGLNRGEVRIEARDVLPNDDFFPFSLARKEASRVLFVHEARQARGAQYVRTALEAT